jgi:hypothetical protein
MIFFKQYKILINLTFKLSKVDISSTFPRWCFHKSYNLAEILDHHFYPGEVSELLSKWED